VLLGSHFIAHGCSGLLSLSSWLSYRSNIPLQESVIFLLYTHIYIHSHTYSHTYSSMLPRRPVPPPPAGAGAAMTGRSTRSNSAVAYRVPPQLEQQLSKQHPPQRPPRPLPAVPAGTRSRSSTEFKLPSSSSVRQLAALFLQEKPALHHHDIGTRQQSSNNSPNRIIHATSPVRTVPKPHRSVPAPPAERVSSIGLVKPAASDSVHAPNTPAVKSCCVVGCNMPGTTANYCEEHHKLFVGAVAEPVQSQSDSQDPNKHHHHNRRRRKLFGCISPDDPEPHHSDEEPKQQPQALLDPLLQEIAEIWNNADAVVFKDLPRLARRISISGNYVDEKHYKKNRISVKIVERPLQEATDESRWQVIEKVIQGVVGHFVTDVSKKSTLTAEMKQIGASVSAPSDLQGVLRKLFHDRIGIDSPSFGIFRAIHQSVLVPAYVVYTVCCIHV
jgi:hypothetical protein